ncbi:MAG: NERD domain-containing protein [Burkholderiales bacterium]|nr:NERD domain-containing protein [Burkholderiales bacterium]
MRIIVLSDHAADQARQAQDAREARHQQALEAWQAAVYRRQATITAHRSAMAAAWRERRLLDLLAGLGRWLSAALSSAPPSPVRQAPSDQEARWVSGQEGEARVQDRLARLLGDEWAALTGYFNRGGETDLLLIGPTAVLALEVKFVNGTVHARGNDWRRDKSDRYGNVVERDVPIRDRKGRAPNEQINATADALQVFLARRGQPIRVRRGVILAHDASRLGVVSQPGVDFIGVLQHPQFEHDLQQTLWPAPGEPTLNVQALEQLVRQDHVFHTQRQVDRRTEQTTDRQDAQPVAATAPAAAPPVAAKTQPVPPVSLKPLAPSAGAGRELSELELRQIDSLERDIIALHRSQGTNPAREKRVRQTVSGHLQSGARYTVLSAARSGLRHTHGSAGDARDKAEREQHWALLSHLIAECRQTVELEDRTLTAIVAPLAVRWPMPEGAARESVRVTEGDQMYVSSPALFIRKATGAHTVRFSRRFYAGKNLQTLDARHLRQALLEIEAGSEPTMPNLKPLALAPSANADWEMVYLLGVAVMSPGERLELDDEQVQRELARQVEGLHAVFTIAAMDATRTHHDVAEGHAEGVWTLEAGVRHGQMLQRRHALESLLTTADGDGRLRCWYSLDLRNDIQLLLDWGATRVQREFTTDPDRGQGFRASLEAAIAAQVPAGTEVELQELSAYDYQRQVQSLGMSWLGQAPGSRRRGGAGRAPSAHPAPGGPGRGPRGRSAGPG